MDENSLVTVITPTFNRSEFLPEAIESVLDQSYRWLELILVDDGSTDNTPEIVRDYCERDGRIQSLFQENQGQSVARNKALAMAKGDFICFLDSDDAWMSDKLEKQIAIMKARPDVDVVYGDFLTMDEKGHIVTRENMTRYSGYIAPQMLKDNCVSMNTAMARRRCFDELGGMSGKRPVADDYDLWLRFSAKYKFLYVSDFYSKYRVMPDQISSDKTRRFNANEQIIHDFLVEYPNAVSSFEARTGLSAFYTRKARYYASVGNKGVAWESIARAMSYNPINVQVWRGLFRVIFPSETGRL